MAAVDKPWLSQYAPGMPAEITPDYPTLLHAFRETVRRGPDDRAIAYFDGSMTWAELDRATDALAVALQSNGFAPGDRLGLYTQNNPAFVLGLLAAWKAGGAAVAINPMNKHRELTYLLEDSGAVALLCLDDLWHSVAAEVVAGGTTAVRVVVTCSARDGQSRNDERLLATMPAAAPADAGTAAEVMLTLTSVLSEFDGQRPPQPAEPLGTDLGVLTYTSGTTGLPKGAMNVHSGMAFNSQTYRDWVDLSGEDTILGVAPLFHITGLIAHVGISLLTGATLVLAHRFEPNVMMDAIREHRPTFTIGSITVFIALSQVPGGAREDWSSFRSLYSGGAAIAPAVADKFEAQTGLYLHNAYGLTETNSPTHLTPLGAKGPVDPVSGALSVGVPVFNTVVRILDEEGKELPAGEVGEIASSGPQIVPGYWQKPEATAEAFPGGELRTGDVGFMDADGWFFIVDRKKDMINASGYKVWPREVEDVLYGHPAVREAAVIGVPDEYRGESVKAYVSLVEGADTSPEEIIAFAKERMAAYKYPRAVEIVPELPKTASGKILRRELRDRT